MGTIEALQGLYVALGGNIKDVANVTVIPDMISAISTIAGGSGSGTEPLVVNGTPDGTSTMGTTDKELAEIAEAYGAGRQIIFRVNGLMDLPLARMRKFTEGGSPIFSFFDLDQSTSAITEYTISADNEYLKDVSYYTPGTEP